MKRINKGRYEDRHLIGIDAYYVDATIAVLILIRTLYTQDDTRDE